MYIAQFPESLIDYSPSFGSMSAKSIPAIYNVVSQEYTFLYIPSARPGAMYWKEEATHI